MDGNDHQMRRVKCEQHTVMNGLKRVVPSFMSNRRGLRKGGKIYLLREAYDYFNIPRQYVVVPFAMSCPS